MIINNKGITIILNGYGNRISSMHIWLFCQLTVDSFWKVAGILDIETLRYNEIKEFDVMAMA